MLARIEIKPSRYFTSLLGLFHLFALLLLWAAYLPIWLQIILTLIIGLSFLRILDRQLLPQGHTTWQTLSLEEKQITISTCNGDELAGTVLIKTVVTRYFIIIWVRLDGSLKTISQIIFFDALPIDAFRELRTRLRLPQ